MGESTINDLLFDNDQKRIANAVQYYPLGSNQLARIAELSAKLHEYGVWADNILEREINRRGIK